MLGLVAAGQDPAPQARATLRTMINPVIAGHLCVLVDIWAGSSVRRVSCASHKLWSTSLLRQDLRNQFPMHISQAHIAAPVAIGQLLVIHPETVEHVGVQVVNR